MIISFKHRLLTIDIPKTGTRTLRETLAPLNVISVLGEPSVQAEFYQHDRLCRIKQTLDNKFKKTGDPVWDFKTYKIFTIIRNPWTRYFSFYNYFKTASENYEKFLKGEMPDWDKPKIHQGKSSYDFFKTESSPKQIMKKIVENNLDQGSYFIYNNNCHADFVASFEYIQDEIKALCESYEMGDPNITHGNKGKYSSSMKETYDQEIIDLIAEKEKKLLDKYPFDYV